MVNMDVKKLPQPITYRDRVLLIGSCFTEHIGNALQDLKFNTLQNPHGILFDPASVCKSLIAYVQQKEYTRKDLFQLNDVWHSWEHHSRFSNIDPQAAIDQMNKSVKEAHAFLKKTDWIIITLGSSFSYRLTGQAIADLKGMSITGDGKGVANCHRAPAAWFEKHMLSIDETITLLDTCYHQLTQFNPNLQVIFTVSPVRHLRDGVIENNRSKARLIEAVHHMVNKFDKLYYFPAYELVIDVLRDYRFYDIDLAHPNYMATSFVLEKFTQSCIHPSTQQLMEEVKKLVTARKHKAFQPDTNAHRQFLKSQATKAAELMKQFEFLNLEEELIYFNGS